MRTIIKTKELQMAMVEALGIADKANMIRKVEIDMPTNGLIAVNVWFLPSQEILAVAIETLAKQIRQTS